MSKAQAIEFFPAVQAALFENNPEKKCAAVFTLFHVYHRHETFQAPYEPPKGCEAGRPESPELVPPKKCAPRDFKSVEGRMSLFHALAHIEFNAINLALDACMRFQNMPEKYYEDWLLVAKEEAYHFQLLRTHLSAMGADYGDFPAHNGLWEMAQKTAHDVLARMGCVPRLLEARGLDVAPSIIEKLNQSGDHNGAKLLEIIMHDEEKHVRIGNHWYHTLCQERGVDPLETFKALLDEFAPNALRPPFAKAARARAGFQASELDWLQTLT